MKTWSSELSKWNVILLYTFFDIFAGEMVENSWRTVQYSWERFMHLFAVGKRLIWKISAIFIHYAYISFLYIFYPKLKKSSFIVKIKIASDFLLVCPVFHLITTCEQCQSRYYTCVTCRYSMKIRLGCFHKTHV